MSEEQFQAMIAAAIEQRNAALDDSVRMSAEIAALRRERAELKHELMEMRRRTMNGSPAGDPDIPDFGLNMPGGA